MNFGQALEALKQGKWVQRQGWNGKNMHIYLEEDLSVTFGDGVFKGQTRKYQPCIVLFNAQAQHQPGWVPAQPDVLAEDWQIVQP